MQENVLTNSINRVLYKLRDYQQQAVDAAIAWIKKNSEPCLLELATGAGKSLVCAEIARVLRDLSPEKKVLCLCPSAELVSQNAEKFELTGEEFSIFSASIGKSLKNNVIFATEGSFKKVFDHNSDIGKMYSCVIIDEAHRITPTIKKIIEKLRKGNPYLRVVGMTATPYRMGTGYIYEIDDLGMTLERDEAVKPYFKKLLFRVTARQLVDLGFLVMPTVGKIGASAYDTKNLKLNKTGNFDSDEVDKAFVGQGNKTAAIVADVINQSNEMQARGAMFFAATVEHAEEIMASLPAYNSALVTGSTPKAERKRIISEYKAQRIKYLVNVACLTTGFDAPHTDVVAILRATESAALFAQIMGRGMRLFDGKDNFLLLDYAGNIGNFFPDGDIFNPEIKAFGQKPRAKIPAVCELCNFENLFAERDNPEGKKIDRHGYFLDIDGTRTDLGGQPYPAHFGRRCTATIAKGHNIIERCTYFWSCKDCPECGHKNDIAARKCEGCGAKLIDPNNKLSIDFERFKMDLTQVQTDKVKNIVRKWVRGREVLLVIFETQYRSFEVFFSKKVNSKFFEIMSDFKFFPTTVSYRLRSDGKHFHVFDFNRPEDMAA